MTRSPDGALHGHGRRPLAVPAAALLSAAGTAPAMSVPHGLEAGRRVGATVPMED